MWTSCVFEDVVPRACTPLTDFGPWAHDERELEECKKDMDSRPGLRNRINPCIEQFPSKDYHTFN